MHKPLATHRFHVHLAVSAGALFCVLAGSAAPAAASGTPKCFGHAATMVGTNGKDHFSGTSKRDVIVAKGGNDKINGKQGDDLICAGSGDDVVHASEDANKMDGGSGDDWLDGRRGTGNVTIGGGGKDFIEAEGQIFAGPGADEIESYGYLSAAENPFPDVANGGDGNDTISGKNKWFTAMSYPLQTLQGGDGDDTIIGGLDDDILQGEAGNDDLDGKDGNDTCDQGPGSGTIVNCEA